MAVNRSKIRLGAPDLMMLDAGAASPVDLGASSGGATLAYNATYFPVEIDQTILAAVAYKTKEDILFSVTLVQSQATILAASMSVQTSNLSTVASGTMGIGGAPTLATFGTAGSTSYSYAAVPFNYNGDSQGAAAVTIATGPATLSSTNGINVNYPAAPAGAVGWKIVRTAGGNAQGVIAVIYSTAAGTFSDTGITPITTPYTLPATSVATPNQDTLTFGGDLSVPLHTFDYAVPKNDGTVNHWWGHLNSCFSSKAVQIDYKRDKQTDLAKCELQALANTSLPVGQQAGWLREMY